jgi:nucleotide-binding universal stress UspA family protein
MSPSPRLPVVVGFDGSVEAESALWYGAAQAAARGTALRVVHGYEVHRPLIMAGYAPYQPEFGFSAASAEQMLQDAARRVTSRFVGVKVECEVRGGSPAANLIDESARAELVVVGAPEHNGLTDVLLGSVAARLTAHGRCPVVVVRRLNPPVAGAPIVVGIEGGGADAAAVEFAFGQARAAGVALQAVHVWAEGSEGDWRPSVSATRRLLANAVAPAAKRFPDVAVDLFPEVDRSPYAVLRDFAATAALIVVSRHGGSPVARFFGSIGDALAREAPCSVAVIPVGDPS